MCTKSCIEDNFRRKIILPIFLKKNIKKIIKYVYINNNVKEVRK